jgi:hypothetical protein
MAAWFNSYGSLVIVVVVIALVIGVARWRIRQFDSIHVDPVEMDQMADAVLTDLRAYCSGPREPIKVLPSYWREIGWSNDKLLRLLYDMSTRGRIELPEFDWRLQRILRVELPRLVALTQSAYDEYTARLVLPPAVVVNGPAHFGEGDQIFHGDVEFHWHDVEHRIDDLVLDIHRERERFDSETAARLDEIASILSRANDGRSYDEPQLRPALRWLAGFATDASANAAGTGLAAAATALLGLLVS